MNTAVLFPYPHAFQLSGRFPLASAVSTDGLAIRLLGVGGTIDDAILTMIDAWAVCPSVSSIEYGIVTRQLNQVAGMNITIALDGLTLNVHSGTTSVV